MSSAFACPVQSESITNTQTRLRIALGCKFSLVPVSQSGGMKERITVQLTCFEISPLMLTLFPPTQNKQAKGLKERMNSNLLFEFVIEKAEFQ